MMKELYSAQQRIEEVLRGETTLPGAVTSVEHIVEAFDLLKVAESLDIDIGLEDPADNPTLQAMLERIPRKWGRYLSCGPGWWPLLGATDTVLTSLIGPYTIQQVKEKFGGLRYYWEPVLLETVLETETVKPATIEGYTGEEADYQEVRRGILAVARRVTNKAERLAWEICERCGNEGVLTGRKGSGWVRTLCTTCAGDEYVALEDEE